MNPIRLMQHMAENGCILRGHAERRIEFLLNKKILNIILNLGMFWVLLIIHNQDIRTRMVS